MTNYSVIVLCAGSGTRTGLAYNKIFYKIEGETVYEKTMNTFLSDLRCKQIIVVTKEDEVELLKEFYDDHRIEYCLGGQERQDSVYSGLQLVGYPNVLIHDGARPYISSKILDDICNKLEQCNACLVMVPCKDTIKKVVNGIVVDTPKRESLMQAQTPQAFKTKIIKDAYQQAKDNNYAATDDCSLVEKYSKEEIHVVLGSYKNIKITTTEDL